MSVCLPGLASVALSHDSLRGFPSPRSWTYIVYLYQLG